MGLNPNAFAKYSRNFDGIISTDDDGCLPTWRKHQPLTNLHLINYRCDVDQLPDLMNPPVLLAMNHHHHVDKREAR
eukprot:scaffold1400_cov140-Chaetoceros_neogracile.AAC.1